MEDLRTINLYNESPEAWDRFMRFMERYGETNGLAFTKAN
jgi:photosystem II reaction center protein Psb28